MQLLEDFIRYVVWIVCEVAFWVVDEVYDILGVIAKIDILSLNNGFVLSLWENFMGALAAAVIIFAIPIFFNAMMNPDKMSSSGFLKRGILLLTIVFLTRFLPIGMNMVSDMSEYAISRISYMLDVPANFVPSSMIVSAGNAAQNDIDTGYYTSEGEYVDTGMIYITVADIQERGINAGSGGVSDIPILGGVADFGASIAGLKNYTYFPQTMYLFITLFIAIYACVLFLIVMLDIAKRLIDLIMLILVSPIAIASIIKDTHLMMTWTKMFVNIFLSNYFEYFFALFSIMSIQMFASLGLFVQIVFMFAILLTALNGSQKIAQLLGIETSGNTLQELANMSLAARGFASMASGVANIGRTFLGGGVRLAGSAVGGVGSLDYGRSTTSYSQSSHIDGSGGGSSGGTGSGGQGGNGGAGGGGEGASIPGGNGPLDQNLNVNQTSKLDENITENNNMNGEDWKMPKDELDSLSGQAVGIDPNDPTRQYGDFRDLDSPIKTQSYSDANLWKEGSMMKKWQDKIDSFGGGIQMHGANITNKEKGTYLDNLSAGEKINLAIASKTVRNDMAKVYGARVKGATYSAVGNAVANVNKRIDRSYSNALRAKQNRIARKAR